MDDCVEIKTEAIDDAELEEKIQKIRDIIMREHRVEIEERENQVETIQEKIQLTQTYMKVLKYVVSFGYYQQGEDSIPTEPGEPSLEPAIHPCVQKLLPSRKSERTSTDTPDTPDTKMFDSSLKEESAVSKKVELDNNLTLVRGTYKVKHKLVVGNVSKWIPPDVREGEATHKWMMYLRDIDRDLELGSLIKKVRYFLHESYKPHDVIDVTSSPFHLTRRGWGEFPVRVKIFFQHPANKPIDFVHSLKLDDTFRGSQVLGGETVIEVDLFHENISDLLPQNESPKKQSLTKKEEVIAMEHDYCSSKTIDDSQNKPKALYQPQQIESHTPSCTELSEEAILREWTPSKNSSVVDWYNDHVLNRVSNIIFLSTEACVKWFLKRWPIVTNSATNSLYKQVHPYSFKSFCDFELSNIGKQRAAEWYRSAKIKNMLEQLNMRPWTTKEIMLYSRMYGYVIVHSKQYYNAPKQNLNNISSYTTNVDSSSDLRQLEHFVTSEEVDVENDEEEMKIVKSPVKSGHDKVFIMNSWVKYVEDVSKEIGAKFGEEEVIPGCVANTSTYVVVRAVKSFLNDLIRKSLANAWVRNSLKCPGSLEVSDILKTILENPEFDILTNAGLGTKPSLS